MLNVPAPTRVPVGTLQVGGQKVDLFLSPEWARYFQTLNSQVLAAGTALAQINALFATLGDGTEAPDLFPAPPGQPGMQGAPGLALFMLQDDARDEPMLVPPSGSTEPGPGSFTSLTASAGFGCNGKAAQGPAASGGTLAGVIAALVANGILSS